MLCNHTRLLASAKAAGLSEDELDVMAEELQHDPDADETENEELDSGSDSGGSSNYTTATKTTLHVSPALLNPVPRPAPTKRKRQAPKSKKFVQEDTCEFYESRIWRILVIKFQLYFTAPPEPAQVVTYLLSITSASESKKKASQRESVSRRIELSSDEPWDTVKAQFLKEIDDALSPNQIQFDHYDVSFKIPRIVSEPTRLISDGDYDFLIRESTKGKTVATVKVQITQKKPAGKVGIILVLF
jgi:hypothetical protein